MFKKILVAIDGSDPSLHALDVAADIAKLNKAQLTIISVVAPLPPMAMESDMPPHMTQVTETIEDSYKTMLASKVKMLKETHPEVETVPIVLMGSPARQIIEASKAREADLIVVGNRGRSGILSWMLGSVSRQVTDACTVPVLVVKNQEFCDS